MKNIKTSKNVQQQLEDFKEEALNRLAVYLLPLVLIAIPASVFRTHNETWPNLCNADYVIIAVVFLILLLGNRIPFTAKVYCYMGLGIAEALVELSEFGLVGGGAFAAVFSLMLPLFYLNRRVTWFVLPLVLAVYGYCMYLFVYAGSVVPSGDKHYMASLSTWVVVLVAGLIFFCLIGLSVSFLQQRIVTLLSELEHRNEIIEEQKQKIEHLANHDPLTGLPSLRLADARLDFVISSAEKGGHQSALLFLDLDGFKAINDTYGHEAGDVVLKEVSKRILSTIRSSDTACRAGGDEFLVVIEKIEYITDISKLCARLVEVISRPVTYGRFQLRVGVSIGAAGYPYGASTARSLRMKADELMYKVKKSGKNNYLISMGDGCLT